MDRIMPSQVQERRSSHVTPTPADFHGAAIVDEHGQEIPITESMVQDACEQLEQCWHYPCTGHSKTEG